MALDYKFMAWAQKNGRDFSEDSHKAYLATLPPSAQPARRGRQKGSTSDYRVLAVSAEGKVVGSTSFSAGKASAEKIMRAIESQLSTGAQKYRVVGPLRRAVNPDTGTEIIVAPAKDAVPMIDLGAVDLSTGAGVPEESDDAEDSAHA